MMFDVQHMRLLLPNEMIAPTEFCVETSGTVGLRYICCGSPPVAIIKHRGRGEGPYAMCLPHAAHNVSNRAADVIEWIGSDEDRELWIQSGRTLP